MIDLSERGLERLEALKKKWGYGDHPPILPATKDIHFLLEQIDALWAALRTRAEQAERERDILLERKGDEKEATQRFLETRSRAVRAEQERDTLRAEAGRLRETLEKTQQWAAPDAHRTIDELMRDLGMIDDTARFALPPTPLSAAALDRTEEK